jgi:uncharacterized protein (DUF1330 family)
MGWYGPTNRVTANYREIQWRDFSPWGETANLEGEPFKGRLVIVELPSLAHVREFSASPEYQDAKLQREGVSAARFIGVQGV